MSKRATKPEITAGQLRELLRQRHAEDLFVPECKDGPTQFGSHRRLDAWAMKRSWANPCYYGYEIKVTRSDFLRDTKWQDYLGLCNELWFVCAPGVCRPDELPRDVGLLEATSLGGRLVTKKRAIHREIEEPTWLLRYVLMCRARITGVDILSSECSSMPREYWHAWLAEKAENKDTGHRLSKKVRTAVEKANQEVLEENNRLRHENQNLADIKKALVELGLVHEVRDLETGTVKSVSIPGLWFVRSRAEQIRSLFDQDTVNTIEHARYALTTLLQAIERARSEAAGPSTPPNAPPLLVPTGGDS